MKDRDPARVDNPFLIEELSEERPGILVWMLEGLHRLLANRYQFTISERSIQNLEAAMADSDNLTQFMQASAYVRFKPDTEEHSTYLTAPTPSGARIIWNRLFRKRSSASSC